MFTCFASVCLSKIWRRVRLEQINSFTCCKTRNCRTGGVRNITRKILMISSSSANRCTVYPHLKAIFLCYVHFPRLKPPSEIRPSLQSDISHVKLCLSKFKIYNRFNFSYTRSVPKRFFIPNVQCTCSGNHSRGQMLGLLKPTNKFACEMMICQAITSEMAKPETYLKVSCFS